MMKSFLDERIAIESDYSSRLEKWGATWKSRSPSCNATNEDDAPGIMHILASAGGVAANGVSAFVSELSRELSSDLNCLLRELDAAIETGTKGVSSLWNVLKEREATVSKHHFSYKRCFKMILDKSTKEIMTLTDCFARADSAGHLLIDDMINSTEALSARGSTDASELSDCIDIYESYQKYCKSVSDAKSILNDLDTLVQVLDSTAKSTASRSAALIKAMGIAMTENFVKHWEETSTRVSMISKRLHLVYAAEAARREEISKDKDESSSCTELDETFTVQDSAGEISLELYEGSVYEDGQSIQNLSQFHPELPQFNPKL